MNEKLFRTKSLERIKSPESLTDYVRVTTPSVWLVLATIGALVIGAIIFAIFGRIDTLVDAHVLVDDGVMVCYIDEEDAARVREGMPLRIGESGGRLGAFVEAEGNSITFAVEPDAPLESGIHSAAVVVESVAPITFVLN